MVQHVHHVLLRPYHAVSRVFIEEAVIAVLAFRLVPFIEVFKHDHESHFVTKFNEFLGWHVVRCPDGVAAHILEDGKLSAQCRLVYRRSERTQIVVHAYAPEFPHLPVQEESFVRTYLNAPYSESGADLVKQYVTVF